MVSVRSRALLSSFTTVPTAREVSLTLRMPTSATHRPPWTTSRVPMPTASPLASTLRPIETAAVVVAHYSTALMAETSALRAAKALETKVAAVAVDLLSTATSRLARAHRPQLDVRDKVAAGRVSAVKEELVTQDEADVDPAEMRKDVPLLADGPRRLSISWTRKWQTTLAAAAARQPRTLKTPPLRRQAVLPTAERHPRRTLT